MKKILLLFLPIFGFSQTLQEAKAAFEKDSESYQGKQILDKIIAKEPANAEAYFLEAKYYLGKNMYAKVRENIEKAVELSPESVDYRWIRANVMDGKDFQKGIDDLNFMISKGSESGKIYLLLGKLNYEYARQLKYRPELKPDYGFSDKNEENEKILAENKSKVKDLLNAAKTAFKRYENLTKESAQSYLVDIERMTEKYPMFDDFFDNVNLTDEQKTTLAAFQENQFTTAEAFLKDLKLIERQGIFIPSENQSECLNYYLRYQKSNGGFQKIKGSNYEDIFAFAEGRCYARDNL